MDDPSAVAAAPLATEAAADGAAAGGLAGLAESSFIVYMLPYTVLMLSVVFVQLSLKNVLPQLVLGDLTYITVAKPGAAVAEPAPVSKKQEKRLQQRRRAAEAAMPSITPLAMSSKILYLLEFTDDLESLLVYLVVLGINAAAAAPLKAALASFPQQAVMVAGTSVGFVIILLFKMEWRHQVIGWQEKVCMALSGLLAAPVAFSLLALLPPGLLAFNAAEAAEELTGRAAAVVQQRLKWADLAALEPLKDATVLAWPLCFVAAVLSGLLLAPGLRYGRLLHQLVNPPVYARSLADPGGAWKLVAQMGFVVQLALIPVWVPLLTDALLLSPGSLVYTRGLAMMLAALLQGLAVPTLVQTWLYTAAFNCRIVNETTQLSAPVKAQEMKRVSQIVLAQTSKVALQLTAVPALLLACGVLHLLMVFPLPSHARSVSRWDSQPSQLFQSVPGFVAWWASLAYLGWASLGVVLAKLKTSE